MKRLASPGVWLRTGRRKLALSLALFSAWLAVDHLLFERSQTWRLLGIAPGPVPFFDTHNVLAALDCTRLGIDPLADNPCDAQQRAMNYPRLWLSLAGTGLGRGDEVWCGLATAAAFVGSILYLAQTLQRGQWLVWFAAIASPAIQFGLARGNTDLWIFAALALAIRLRTTLPTASAAAWAALCALKLYPAFSARTWLAGPGGARPARYCTGALLLYWLATSPDLVRIAEALPSRGAHTYGAANLGQLLAMGISGTKLNDSALLYTGLLGRLGVAALLLWSIAANRHAGPEPVHRTHRRLDHNVLNQPPVSQCPQWAQDAFQAGASIYVATYAVASNWNYRMVFLLLLLPQLLHSPKDTHSDSASRPRCSNGWLVGWVLATLWSSGYPRFYLLYVDEWLALGLAVVLCGRLARHGLHPTRQSLASLEPFVDRPPTPGTPTTRASGRRQSAALLPKTP